MKYTSQGCHFPCNDGECHNFLCGTLALWKHHHVIMNQLNWKYTGIREASAEQEEVDSGSVEGEGSMETRRREFEAPM